MALEHWMTTGLLGATGTFQRAAREYAEEYAAMAVAAERERCARLCDKESAFLNDDAFAAQGASLCADAIRMTPNV